MSEPEFETIRYETPAAGVARVVLARVEQRNAQDKRMLYELNAAFDRAAHDVPLQSRTFWAYAAATALSLLVLAAVLGLIERGRRRVHAGL